MKPRKNKTLQLERFREAKYRILIVMAISVLVTSYELRAEERTLRYDLGKVIVTATKTETYQAEVGSASTIISKEEMLKSGKTSVFEVLKDTPGIAVAQNGPFGGLASVYLRGSKPGHTLFMIDGIELNDPMSTDRSFNPAHLTIDNIEHIEVIRGPQSTLYGSDAMAGVVNIITQKGEGKPHFEMASQVGSCNTSRESLWFGGSTKVIDYSLAFSEMNSRGISKARYGSDPDGYDNTTISSRFGWQMYDEAKLNLYLRFTDTQTDLDDGAFEDDPNYTMWDRQFASRAEFLQVLRPWWEHKFSFSYSDITRKYRDEKDPIDRTEDVQNWYKGDVKKLEWQNNFPIFDWNTVTAGFEFERERGSSYYRSGTSITKIDRRFVDTKGYYLQDQLKIFERLFITPGLRIDYHKLFKTETTYRISSSYLLPELGANLKANWGTGFKSPSLYQLYSQYGNDDLKPDKSISYDVGIEEEFLPGVIKSSIAYFHNDFKDMVDWDSVTSKYKNISRARTWGYEMTFEFKPINTLSLQVWYTYTATKDVDSGKRLVRRPENDVGIGIDWTFITNTRINMKTRYVDRTWNDANNNQKVEAYSVTDLNLFYNLTKNLELFLKVENLFDRRYEEVYGYSTLRRSLYIGGKVVF